MRRPTSEQGYGRTTPPHSSCVQVAAASAAALGRDRGEGPRRERNFYEKATHISVDTHDGLREEQLTPHAEERRCTFFYKHMLFDAIFEFFPPQVLFRDTGFLL